MAGVTRVGATKQYSDNWENIFGAGQRRAPAKKKSATPARPLAKRKPAKKKAQPKAAKRSCGRK